jgi:hypothetical protein
LTITFAAHPCRNLVSLFTDCSDAVKAGSAAAGNFLSPFSNP